MQYNRELVQKADLQLADLAPGGLLVPKQAARFLRIAIKKNVLSQRVRVPTMTHPEERQPKILWTGRVMHAASSGVALSDAQRSKPSFDRMTLISKLGKAEVHIHREVLEDQIERNVLRQTVVDFMGEKVSADFEEALINGDTASGDDWLALQDGLVKKATSNVLLAGVVSLDGPVLRDLIQTLPEEFDDQEGLNFFTNRKARSDYRSSIRTRATDVGDAIITGAAPGELGYDGVPLVKVPRFPNSLGAGTNETVVMHMDPKNAVMGFQRRITLDTEFRISEQVWAIVITVRMAIEFEHEPAVAKATGVIGK
jgi:hypothetical protein